MVIKSPYMLDNNVGLLPGLDGNAELFAYTPIDSICEFYGVIRDDKNRMVAYMDKGVERADHIQTIEAYFMSIGMPIPGGFISYRNSLFPKVIENVSTTEGPIEGDGEVQPSKVKRTVRKGVTKNTKRKSMKKDTD